MVITIGREYASHGHIIGRLVAEKLGIKYYDKESLAEEAKKSDRYEELQAFYEEQPINSLLYVIATGSYNGGKQAQVPFEFIRQVAAREDCVIVGRAGNFILRGQPDHVSVFIHAPEQVKLDRIMKDFGLNEKKARQKLETEDKAREGFHTYYTDEKWKVACGYDLCIDSSSISEDEAADLIIEFARRKLKL